ncbi:restriction endonuclease subunit S [Streptococcus pluranimalium]|uniref:restriction endonuclease subunit S n=1 Tax=Streptococcus pluranimalium TaxID=82348 RepID=UPI004046F164
MTYIDEMIKELCPDGVEWKELGGVCEVNKGKQLNKTLLTADGEYPAYNGGKTYSGRTDNYNVEANTIIVSQGGASAGFVNFVETRFWANAHCYYLLPDMAVVDNRYLYHFLKMNQNYLMEFQHGAGIPALKSDKLTKLKMPIPPLEIQNEIVKILDKFTDYVTELTAELTAELTLRQKQYSFYRDRLLSFEDQVYQVEWKTLGEIGKISMCKRILKNQTSEKGEIPFYKIGTFGKEPNAYISKELFEEYKNKFSYPKKGDILISASGTIGRTVIFDGQPAYFQDSNIVWLAHDESQVLNKYLYYFYQMNPWKASEGGTIARLYNDSIAKIKVPVPHLDIQSRIVQVLGNFDTVCNDLKIGLPKEIELRQKQYEFFRDKLLTFAAEGVYTDSTVQTRPD